MRVRDDDDAIVLRMGGNAEKKERKENVNVVCVRIMIERLQLPVVRAIDGTWDM